MTARQSIGGRLDYAALAQLNRPCDPTKLNAEIKRLRGNGLTDRDISAALQIPLSDVINTLATISIQNHTEEPR